MSPTSKNDTFVEDKSESLQETTGLEGDQVDDDPTNQHSLTTFQFGITIVGFVIYIFIYLQFLTLFE